jgi:hypothetical protein
VLAALDGRRADALAGFTDAVRRWRDLGFEFEAAVCALNFVTTIGGSEPEVRAAAEDARAVFERLGAQPFMKRLDAAVRSSQPVPASRPGSAPVEEPSVRASSE